MLTITEIARLTNKSRPTIYKFLSDYNDKKLNDIPYSFVELFRLMEKKVSKKEIIEYCRANFIDVVDIKLQEIINLLSKNKDKINLEKIINFIEEELKNE